MTAAAIDFDLATGTLRANEYVLRLLLTYAITGQFPPRSVGADELFELHNVGALDDNGGLVESLACSLAVVLRPARTAELTQGGHRVRAWSTAGITTLLTPMVGDPSRRSKLVRIPAALLPEALARLVDLGPRPYPHLAETVPFDQSAFPSIRRRWRLVTGRAPANGDAAPRYQELEILDTDNGLWRLDTQAPSPTATPITSTQLWRLLVRCTVAGDTTADAPAHP